MFLPCLLFNSDFFFEKYEQEEENLSVWLLSLVISWCKHLLRNHFIKYSTCRLFAGLHNRSMYSVISLTLSTLCQSTPNHLKQVTYDFFLFIALKIHMRSREKSLLRFQKDSLGKVVPINMNLQYVYLQMKMEYQWCTLKCW